MMAMPPDRKWKFVKSHRTKVNRVNQRPDTANVIILLCIELTFLVKENRRYTTVLCRGIEDRAKPKVTEFPQNCVGCTVYDMDIAVS
jgi:hypothetical protein